MFIHHSSYDLYTVSYIHLSYHADISKRAVFAQYNINCLKFTCEYVVFMNHTINQLNVWSLRTVKYYSYSITEHFPSFFGRRRTTPDGVSRPLDGSGRSQTRGMTHVGLFVKFALRSPRGLSTSSGAKRMKILQIRYRVSECRLFPICLNTNQMNECLFIADTQPYHCISSSASHNYFTKHYNFSYWH